MTIVGLGGSGHEWSSCATDGHRLVAIAEERLSRRKYGLGADLLAAASRQACLAALGADRTQVEAVVACSLVPKTFYHGVRDRTVIINHHLAHAYSAFAGSGFASAAVLVADNSGSALETAGNSSLVETLSLFEADGDGIRLVQRTEGEHRLMEGAAHAFYQPGQTANSLGHLYRSVTLRLGFGFTGPNRAHPFSEDGKTMGLAPYGDDRFVDQLAHLIELLPDGRLSIPIDQIGPALDACFGDGSEERRMALAYAVQHHVERALLHCARWVRARTGQENLCIAGGVGLNSVANGLLARESGFKRVFVVPAPSDDGISLGCAYYGLHKIAGLPMDRMPRLATAYLGPEPSLDGIEEDLRARGLAFDRSDDPIGIVATALADGAVVGWWAGQSEFGPRALGHRSILAAPFPGIMRDRLNFEVKHREWFRPYGPVVPIEHKDTYFDFPGEAPFMSFVCPVRQPDAIPAATHVDGTARLQTLREDQNPDLHALLTAFGKLTGVPVLINTSFNHAGEPIVETAAEALDAAVRMGFDQLVLDGRVVRLTRRG